MATASSAHPIEAAKPTRASFALPAKPSRPAKRILVAAARVFRQKGYYAGTIDDIARELQATKGTIYYYFKAKADILYQLHTDHLHADQQILKKAQRQKGKQSVETRLRQVLLDIVSMMYKDIDQSAVINQTVTEMKNEYVIPATFWREVQAARKEVERLMQGLIHEGIEQGAFRPCDPVLTTKFILGVLNWATVWLNPHGKLASRQMGSLVADFVLNGLKAGPVAAKTPRPVRKRRTLTRPSALSRTEL